MKIAYIMSRFPKLTETFVLFEILELERRGVDLSIYPLLRHKASVTHADVQGLVVRANFAAFLSAEIVRANWQFLRARPKMYLSTLVQALRWTLGSWNYFIGALAYFPKAVLFAAKMRREGVSHIHAHFSNHPALVAWFVSKLAGIPFSFTAHGSDLHKDQRMLAEKVAAADFVVTVSEYNKRFIQECCGTDVSDAVQVIHCGVDTSFFHPEPHRARPSPFRIVCVASFERVKGHFVLLDACRILRDRQIRFECRLIGDGPLKQEVEDHIAAASLSECVRLVGPKPRAEVRENLWEAHLAVLPSVPTSTGQREGIPVSLMEAMACGVPVISSDMSGIPELVENGTSGILLPPGDSAALADAMANLLHDPDLASAVGTAGRRKVVSQFDLATNVCRLQQLFNETSSANRPPILTLNA